MHWQKRYQLHRVGWLVYISYELVGDWLFATHPGRSILLSSTQVLLRFLEFYSGYGLVFPLLSRPGSSPYRIGQVLMAIGGIVGMHIGLRYGIEEWLYPRLFGFGNYNPATSLRYYVSDNLYFASPAILVSWLVWTVERAIQQEEENQQLRAQLLGAEEAFLRAQIAPHFLFNTLNYLYVLAYPISPPLAAAMLKLAELMRYTLAANAAGQVALGQEITYLRNYVDLYRLRFPDTFFVDFTLEGDWLDQQIAALVLLPFVENAIKHGVVDQATDPIRIHLAIHPGSLLLSVCNALGNHHKEATSGIGIDNVRRRLALLYPGQHELLIEQTPTHFQTRLQLPIHALPVL